MVVFPITSLCSFNPRTHTGCDSFKRVFKYPLRCFNPRTHTGCDFQRARVKEGIDIVSIHAPTRGATRKERFSDASGFVFQSTHPHGVRRFNKFNIFTTYLFQSTHPHGVRPHRHLLVVSSHNRFQSTHPHGVRLVVLKQKTILTICFNPRTHTGCDLFELTQEILPNVSIHAPTRGATNKTKKTHRSK